MMSDVLKRVVRARVFVLLMSIVALGVLDCKPASAGIPEYHIELDPAHLALLNQTPIVEDVLYVERATGDAYFPALFICDGDTVECEVRHRGSWSMFFPRRSWRLSFDNDETLGSEKININSEYKDKGGMRNLLTNCLFTFLGWPAPETFHVNFYVNGEYMGVFSQIENVDEEFLEKHGRKPGNMYKLGDHGGAMAPLTRYHRYERTWMKKIGDPMDNSDIQLLFNKILYWTKDDFDNGIASLVDIDNVLTYFAVMHAIVGGDSCTKNYYLYHNPDTGLFEILPWDTDDAFRGEHADATLSIYSHVLFQRLMENEAWRDQFNAILKRVVHEGFEYLDDLVVETYELIKNDIHRDRKREATYEEFERDVEYMRTFMEKRREYIDGRTFFARKPLSDLTCSNPFPSAGDEVTFTVRSEASQLIYLEYTDDLVFNTMGSKHTVKSVMLYDDGGHGDGEAGDLVYGTTFTVPSGFRGIIPYCLRASHKYTYPWNGLFYVQWVRYNTPALNVKNSDPASIKGVRLGSVYNHGDDVFIELKNTSSANVDISYCHIRGERYYEDFMLPAYTKIRAGKSLFVTTNAALAEQVFSDYSWVYNYPVGNMGFTVGEGENYSLLSPAMTELDAAVCDHYETLEVETFSVVINEVNYNSHDDHDTEDWVELYNPNGVDLDLGSWVFKDGDDSHAYVFPENTTIRKNGFLVISRDREKLQRNFSWTIPVTGDIDFSLSGGGEELRLYDRSGVMIDYVDYDDKEPWPVEADGEGATLSLVNPVLDNEKPSSWMASRGHGTPGKMNDIYSVDVSDGRPAGFSLGRNHPNPFNPKTTISYTLGSASDVRLTVYTVHGQHVVTLVDGHMSSGVHSVVFDATDLSSGTYIYRLRAGNYQASDTMTLVK